MSFTPLTREQFHAMTDNQRTIRRLVWADIIRGLQADHDRRYHAPERRAALRGAA
jgi:hypothetical protein